MQQVRFQSGATRVNIYCTETTKKNERKGATSAVSALVAKKSAKRMDPYLLHIK